ncbi:k+ channel tetramerization domain-containing protein [Cystoisospora suis]|uniref:K+ channel tetramerization domain-containing protein n=1 Tax=Cystoisospora suis TaxID=483139 RepID=A0A2C6KVF9_9APIC|nr:k+ channel tetramerization domain-containing protein [Cystoisospora suis]
MLDSTGRDLLSPSPGTLASHSKSVNEIQEMSSEEKKLSYHPHASSPPLTLPLRSASPSPLPSLPLSQSKRTTHQSTQTSPSLSSSSTREVRSRTEDHRISLNVGGKVYETTTETLLSVRGSYFTALLSSLWSDSTEEEEEEEDDRQNEVAEEVHEPHWDVHAQERRRTIRRKRREKGRKEIFVDRNGERFSYILDYLRDGVLVCPLEKSLLQGLLLEAKFFGLPSMVSDIQTSLDFLQRQQACRAIQYASERLQAAAMHATTMSSSSSSSDYLFLPPSPVLPDPTTGGRCMTSSVQSTFPAYTRRIPGGGTGVSSNGCLVNPSPYRPPHFLSSSSSSCIGTACSSSSSLLSSPLVSSSAPCPTDHMHHATPAYTREEGHPLSSSYIRGENPLGLQVRRVDRGLGLHSPDSSPCASSSLSPSSSSSYHPSHGHHSHLACSSSSSSSSSSRGSSQAGRSRSGGGGGPAHQSQPVPYHAPSDTSDVGSTRHTKGEGRNLDRGSNSTRNYQQEDSLDFDTDDGYRRSLINDDPEPPKPLMLDLLTSADAQLRFGEKVFRTDADF